MTDDPIRCAWATTPLGIVYHDEEWGVPVHDDRWLFEMLVLEGAQAGLSWETILRKRERYREVFDGFDPARVARYGPQEVERLLSDPGIVRHRGKIEAAITNARTLLDVREELGSFDALVWGFVGGRPRRNDRWALAELPPKTRESEAMSRELRRRGFRFVGPTICYAFMQAVGLVNDHTTGCFRQAEIGGEPW
jgi:DNA-3-methyladenine glycosylase I